jgi:hypothetical protein
LFQDAASLDAPFSHGNKGKNRAPRQVCQSAFNFDPPSASNFDPPQLVSFCQNFLS